MRNNDKRYENIASIPNAGKRSYGALSYYIAEGLEPGLPDVIIAIPKIPLHGMFIEFKRRPNKISNEQFKWAERLKWAGYAIKVCWSFEDAKKTTEDWMS